MKLYSLLFAWLGICSLFASPSFSDSDLTQLINDLRGADDHARIAARQWLPYQGVQAISPLMALLPNKNPMVEKAAKEILFDIANEVGAPGREVDRKQAADLFVSMLAADQPEMKRITGLSLLALSVPIGYDVSPIAALLQEEKLREKARTALERMATPEACAALCNALDGADPNFQCALLHSLAELRNPGSVKIIEAVLLSPNFDVQIAAAKALSFTGNPAYWENLRKAKPELTWTPEQKGEVNHILLAYLETMIQQGNKRQALPVYQSLAEENTSSLQLSAIATLGRYGDDSVVPTLIRILIGGDLRVRQCAAQALSRMEGNKITEKLIAVYLRESRQHQLALLSILGARKDVRAFPILLQNVKSDEPEFRLAAAQALGESGNPDGLDILLKAVERESKSENKEILTNAAIQLAQAAGRKGQTEKAGKALVKLYELASEESQRNQVVKGIAAYPIPEAYDIALTYADSPVNIHQKLSLLLPIAYSLQKSGELEKQLTVFKKIQSFQPTLQTIAFAAQELKKLGGDVDLSIFQGYVTHWLLVGPFPFPDKKEWNTPRIGEPNIKLKDAYPVGDKKLSWKSVLTQYDQGRVNLLSELGECEQSIGYAYTEIAVPEATDAEIRMGVDDGEILWVNGEKVFDNLTARPFQTEQDRVPVKLKAGTNTILLKIYQNQLAWEFNLRITTPKDGYVPFVQKENK